MPTAAKLIGGLLFALTAFIATYFLLIVKNTMGISDELYVVNAIIGFLVGWRSIGKDPGFGGPWSILSGLRGGLLFVMSSGIFYGLWVTVLRLERFLIKKFADVISTWFDETIAYIVVMAQTEILITLIVGACITGIGAGLANRYWA